MSSPLRQLVVHQGAIIEQGTKHKQIRYRGRLVGILPDALDTDNPATIKRMRAKLRRAGFNV